MAVTRTNQEPGTDACITVLMRGAQPVSSARYPALCRKPDSGILRRGCSGEDPEISSKTAVGMQTSLHGRNRSLSFFYDFIRAIARAALATPFEQGGIRTLDIGCDPRTENRQEKFRFEVERPWDEKPLLHPAKIDRTAVALGGSIPRRSWNLGLAGGAAVFHCEHQNGIAPYLKEAGNEIPR